MQRIRRMDEDGGHPGILQLILGEARADADHAAAGCRLSAIRPTYDGIPAFRRRTPGSRGVIRTHANPVELAAWHAAVRQLEVIVDAGTIRPGQLSKGQGPLTANSRLAEGRHPQDQRVPIHRVDGADSRGSGQARRSRTDADRPPATAAEPSRASGPPRPRARRIRKTPPSFAPASCCGVSDSDP